MIQSRWNFFCLYPSALVLCMGGACADGPVAVAPQVETGATEQKIIGGTDVPNEYPEVMPLWSAPAYTENTTINCTATRISEYAYLTAAHCVYRRFVSYIGGSSESYKGRRLVALCIPSPQFTHDTSWLVHDVAICFTHVKSSPPGPVAALIPEDQPLQAGEPAFIVGYGKSRPNDASSAGTKRFLSTRIKEVKRSGISVDETNGTACHGDSGGPLLVERNGRLVVAGVLSHHLNSDCRKAVWTPVASQLRSFIQPVANLELGFSTPPSIERHVVHDLQLSDREKWELPPLSTVPGTDIQVSLTAAGEYSTSVRVGTNADGSYSWLPFSCLVQASTTFCNGSEKQLSPCEDTCKVPWGETFTPITVEAGASGRVRVELVWREPLP